LSRGKLPLKNPRYNGDYNFINFFYFLGSNLSQGLSFGDRPQHSGGAAQLTQSKFGLVSGVKIEINLLRPNSA